MPRQARNVLAALALLVTIAGAALASDATTGPARAPVVRSAGLTPWPAPTMGPSPEIPPAPTVAPDPEPPAEEASPPPASVEAPAPSARPGYPRGCTTAGTFDEGPCIPPATPCALPAYVCHREAGSINVWNHGGSGASGKYQFIPSTWADFGGYEHAAWAPEAIQDEKATALWNGGAGCSHWSAC